jgi:hypothetical protein
MKPRVAIIICLALVSTLAKGETFIGPTTATNRLLVASNSAIIITTTLGDFTNSAQIAQGVGGSPSPLYYFAPLANGTEYALAGPAELVFPNAALITYYVLTNSTISTQTIAHRHCPGVRRGSIRLLLECNSNNEDGGRHESSCWLCRRRHEHVHKYDFHHYGDLEGIKRRLSTRCYEWHADSL